MSIKWLNKYVKGFLSTNLLWFIFCSCLCRFNLVLNLRTFMQNIYIFEISRSLYQQKYLHVFSETLNNFKIPYYPQWSITRFAVADLFSPYSCLVCCFACVHSLRNSSNTYVSYEQYLFPARFYYVIFRSIPGSLFPYEVILIEIKNTFRS